MTELRHRKRRLVARDERSRELAEMFADQPERLKRLDLRPRLCGARTRKGTPCRCLALANGRCKLHGGLSTGPRTEEGRQRTREGFRAWLERKRASRFFNEDAPAGELSDAP